MNSADCCSGHSAPPVRCAGYNKRARGVDVHLFAHLAATSKKMPVIYLDRDKSVCVLDVYRRVISLWGPVFSVLDLCAEGGHHQ